MIFLLEFVLIVLIRWRSDKKSCKYVDKDIDIITNVKPRSFPKGQSVEVVNCKTFLSHYKKLSAEEDLEHVTRYFYKNSTFLIL